MWQTEIERQYIVVEERRFSAADREELARLSSGMMEDEALRAVYAFLAEWFSPGETVEVQTSGSTGAPKRMVVEKERMMRSAIRTCGFLGLCPGDTSLLCMDLKFIGAKMMVVRALVAGLCLRVRRASSHPLADVDGRIDFTAVVPMQLYNTLGCVEEREKLSRVRHVLVGGGAVDDALQRELAALPCRVYSTYGMTETLSHIALRPLNGKEASAAYRPFEGVRLSLSPRGTLVVDAPELCASPLETNDVVRLLPDGAFVVVGRADNTVNSGGIKIQIEEEERRLRGLIDVPFALTAVADARLGEALVLLLSRGFAADDATLLRRIKAVVPRYHAPQHIVRVAEVPMAGNGKIDRKACRSLAAEVCGRRR